MDEYERRDWPEHFPPTASNHNLLLTVSQNLHLPKAHNHILLQHRAANCVLLTGVATVAHQHTDNLNNDARGVSGRSLLGHDGRVILLVFFVRVGRCVHLLMLV